MAPRIRTSKRPQLKRVFLGCEGDSEQSYGAWIQAIAEDLRLPITIDTYNASGINNLPHQIIKRCLDQIPRREKRRGKYFVRGILLDSDNLGIETELNQDTIDLAINKNIHVIFQEYEHEALLLRQIPGHSRDRPAIGEGREKLQAAWPEYRRSQGKIQLYEKFTIDDIKRVCTVEPVLQAFLQSIGFPV